MALERFLGREVDGRVAPAITDIAAVWPVGFFLSAEALHSGPRLDQRAVEAEVIARQQPPDARLRQDRRQEANSDVAVKQPVAVR